MLPGNRWRLLETTGGRDVRFKVCQRNPEIVKQNIKNKFQDSKLGLVDEVIELDAKNRAAKKEADDLRANKNKIAKQIGA